MAPAQSMMRKFLYEGRVPDPDSVHAQVESSGEVQCEQVLLGTPGTYDDIDVSPTATPEVVILDPKVASPAHELARARRRSYELNRHFQDSWAARLPWAESVVSADGTVRQVRCKICSEVEGREKLLVPKVNSIWKHCGRRKATNSFGKVKAGQHYFLSNNVHTRNEKTYFARLGNTADTILQQVAKGTVKGRKRKTVQFRAILWLLMQGRPLTQYEAIRDFLELLHVPYFPTKYWSSAVGWEMADHLAMALAEHTREVISTTRFFSLSADEVSTIDAQSWLSIHIYVCIGFRRVPILLSLSCLEGGNGALAVREMIEGMLSHHFGLSPAKVASRLVCFGADGVSVFQGRKNGVTTQMRQHMAPFVIGVHCMAHRTNLAVEPLSDLPVVAKVEALCQAMFSYFSHSPKRQLEF